MYILEMLKQGLLLIMLLSLPPMITAVVVGIIISLVQSMMQLQDATLPFILKLIATGIVLALTGRWILQEVVQLGLNCFNLIGQAGL